MMIQKHIAGDPTKHSNLELLAEKPKMLFIHSTPDLASLCAMLKDQEEIISRMFSIRAGVADAKADPNSGRIKLSVVPKQSVD